MQWVGTPVSQSLTRRCLSSHRSGAGGRTAGPPCEWGALPRKNAFAPQTGAGRSQQLGIITSFMVPLPKAVLAPCQDKPVPLVGAKQDGGAKAARGQRSEVTTYSLLLKDRQACCTHQQKERWSDRLSPCPVYRPGTDYERIK